MATLDKQPTEQELYDELSRLRAELAEANAKLKDVEDDREEKLELWMSKYNKANAARERVEALIEKVEGFREHGVAKDGTHAKLMFAALDAYKQALKGEPHAK